MVFDDNLRRLTAAAADDEAGRFGARDGGAAARGVLGEGEPARPEAPPKEDPGGQRHEAESDGLLPIHAVKLAARGRKSTTVGTASATTCRWPRLPGTSSS